MLMVKEPGCCKTPAGLQIMGVLIFRTRSKRIIWIGTRLKKVQASESSGGQSSNLHLNVQFFYTSVN